MKKPINIEKISLYKEMEKGPYPMHGFLGFSECELGNGDCFGLYWAIGKEYCTPIVCEKWHDEGIVVLRFSSLDKFIEWYEINGGEYRDEDVDEEIEIEDDDFCLSFLHKGNDALKSGNIDLAIENFRKSTDSFSELSESWYKLGTQYFRKGLVDEGNLAIVNSISSNWIIGFPSENAQRLFKNLKPSESIVNNPLFKYRESLEFNYGGTKVNNTYLTLRKIIDELYEKGDIIEALKMEQNYGYMMSHETSSFQERCDFELKKWRKDFDNDMIKKLNRKNEP